jgi:hypothetical protein
MSIYGRTQFNYIFAEASAGPEFDLGSRRVSLAAGVGRSWYGMVGFSRHVRLSAGIAQRIDRVSQLRLDSGVRWSSNELNALQDGRGSSLRISYERALSPRLFVTASGGADRFAARDPGYSTRSATLGASAHRELRRVTLSLGAELGWLEADERLILFPEPRKDSFSRFSIGGTFRHLTVRGFSPMARFVIERNLSNIELHDFNRTRTEVGISRAF